LVLFMCRYASVSPDRLAYLHGIGRALRSGTNSFLRIKSMQVSCLILIPAAAGGGLRGLPARLGSEVPCV